MGANVSSLVGSVAQSKLNPFSIYDGPRVGDEFLEWNPAMGQYDQVGTATSTSYVPTVVDKAALLVTFGLVTLAGYKVGRAFSEAK